MRRLLTALCLLLGAGSCVAAEPLDPFTKSMRCAGDATAWFNNVFLGSNMPEYSDTDWPTHEQVRAIAASIPEGDQRRLVATTRALFDTEESWTRERYLALPDRIHEAFLRHAASAFAPDCGGVTETVGDFIYAYVQEGLGRPYTHSEGAVARTSSREWAYDDSQVYLAGVILELNGVQYDFGEFSELLKAQRRFLDDAQVDAIEGTRIMDMTDSAGLGDVGTFGAPGFDAKSPYALVLRPVVTAAGVVRIPVDPAAAWWEMEVALQQEVLDKLHLEGEVDPVCVSDDDRIDGLLRSWMIVHWRLRDRHPLTETFAGAGRLQREAAAEAILRDLCANQD